MRAATVLLATHAVLLSAVLDGSSPVSLSAFWGGRARGRRHFRLCTRSQRIRSPARCIS